MRGVRNLNVLEICIEAIVPYMLFEMVRCEAVALVGMVVSELSCELLDLFEVISRELKNSQANYHRFRVEDYRKDRDLFHVLTIVHITHAKDGQKDSASVTPFNTATLGCVL